MYVVESSPEIRFLKLVYSDYFLSVAQTTNSPVYIFVLFQFYPNDEMWRLFILLSSYDSTTKVVIGVLYRRGHITPRTSSYCCCVVPTVVFGTYEKMFYIYI